jgi:methanogenic corrinoid protein MtbC1
LNEFEKEAGLLRQEAKKYLKSLLQADRITASKIVQNLVERGTDIKDIYISIFQASQHEIGRLWQTNRINVAQEHYCTAATQVIMSQLYPYVFRTPKLGHRMVAACVNGELHELGIRMVADFFEMEGWDTYYLGANTPVKSLLESLSQFQAEILCISATINFNVSALSELITLIRQSADTSKIKILAGGRPFNIAPDLWWKMGADGYAADAKESISRGIALLDKGFLEEHTRIQNDLPAISKEALAAFRAASPEIIKETVALALLSTADIAQHGDQAERLITSGLEFTTRMLDSAMSTGSTALILDELLWAKDRLPHDKVSMQQVSNRMKLYRNTILKKLPPNQASEVISYIDWMTARMDRLNKINCPPGRYNC